MTEILEETTSGSPEYGFVVDTDQKAEWALSKIKEARAERDRMVSWYESKIKEIKETTDFETMNLEARLADYFRMVPHKKTKTTESYALPGGKLVMKKQNPEYKRDDKAVIAWLKDHGGARFIKITEVLDWAGLKDATAALGGKLFDENGEEIAGIDVIEREEKFVVEV